jgi:hypothetical protein
MWSTIDYFFQDPCAATEDVGRYFRLRFEAAEERYARMKGLVRAALENVRCVEKENKGLRLGEVFASMGLDTVHFETLLSAFIGKRSYESSLNVCIEKMTSELVGLRLDNSRLIQKNKSLLVAPVGAIMYHEDPEIKATFLLAIEEAKEFKPTIAKLQAQVRAMEFDWTQAKNMRDELFDYDDKLRECEMVADKLCLKRAEYMPGEGKLFATSRRHMIEILVEDRNRNINGFFARRVVPLERLRMEKDSEILELRLAICKLQLVVGSTVPGIDLTASVTAGCIAETRLCSLNAACVTSEAKMEELQRTIANYEDHASEWKTAHDQAVDLIHRADTLRPEYTNMMAALREEDNRLVAKKKELDLQVNVNIHGRFDRMREISGEVDEVEGEIALKENALKRLSAVKSFKERTLVAEKSALGVLESQINGLVSRRLEFEAFLETRAVKDATMEESLLVEFSGVFV